MREPQREGKPFARRDDRKYRREGVRTPTFDRNVLRQKTEILLMYTNSMHIGQNDLRDPAIDVVKGICILMVLVWHLQPVTKSMMHLATTAGVLGWMFFGFLYWHVALLAMPAFICISIMLFVKKSLVAGNYWKKRLKRLSQLFIFWTCIQFVAYLLVGGGFPLPLGTAVPGGGPALPYVGDSVFHFLFALMVCTGLAAVFLRLPDRFKLIVSIIIIALSCSNFIISSHYKVPMGIDEMENYFLYVPIAYYLVRYRDRLADCRVFFLAGFALALVYEVDSVRSVISPYARLSVVFGVLSLISIMLSLPFRRVPSAEFLSRYSLGIFALHQYWHYVFVLLLGILKARFSVNIVPERLIVFSTTVVLTFLSVYLLGRTKLRSLVS